MRVIVIDTEERKMRALEAIRNVAISELSPQCVRIGPYEHTRSAEQNRRYWSMLQDIAEQCAPEGKWYARELWHEHFKRSYLPHKDVTLPSGQVVAMPVSSAGLTAAEFSRLIDQVMAWAIEHDVQITGDA